jgi:hypothetical protein
MYSVVLLNSHLNQHLFFDNYFPLELYDEIVKNINSICILADKNIGKIIGTYSVILRCDGSNKKILPVLVKSHKPIKKSVSNENIFSNQHHFDKLVLPTGGLPIQKYLFYVCWIQIEYVSSKMNSFETDKNINFDKLQTWTIRLLNYIHESGVSVFCPMPLSKSYEYIS